MTSKIQVYITKGGDTLHYRRISPLAFQHIESQWRKKKPKPPTIQVLIPGSDSLTRPEVNLADPLFQEELEIWEEEKGMALLDYAFTYGFIDSTPEDFYQDHKDRFPEADSDDIKVMWISSLIPTDEESQHTIALLIGSVMPTEEGVSEAEGQFRRSSEQSSDNGLGVQGPANGQDNIQSSLRGSNGSDMGRDDSGRIRSVTGESGVYHGGNPSDI